MDVTLPIVREQMRRVFIRYSDAKGDITERIIQPLFARGEIDPDAADMRVTVSKVDARCETTRAKRTFFINRIEQVADFKTGEVMTPDNWVKTLSVDTSDLQQSIQLHRQMRDIHSNRELRELEAEWHGNQQVLTKHVGLWRACGFVVLVGIVVYGFLVASKPAKAAPAGVIVVAMHLIQQK